MSSNNKPLVPKLRFPEFIDSGEWIRNRLDEIAERITDRVGAKELITLSITAGVGFVSQAEKFSRDISGEQYENYIQLKEGEFSYNKGNSKRFPQGCIYKLKEYKKAAVPKVYISFKLNKGYVPDFYKGYFDNNFHGSQLQKYITSGARSDGLLNISPNDFFSIVLPTPPERNEQQKIADCLTSLDELIAAETGKLEAYKAHKKGLMQKLFPAEGETLPEWRFPEFRGTGEWDEKFVEDFFLVGSSKRVLQEEWTTQGVPFYRTRELVSLSKNEPFSSEIFISEKLFYEIVRKYGLPAEGDFLVSGVGTLGISYQVKQDDRFYFKDGNVLWLKLKSGDGIVSSFFKHTFQTDIVQNQIVEQTSKSTVGTYTINNAKKTKFYWPTDLNEQQKIADCLNLLDVLIAAQSQKVDTLVTHKRALMQGLFPSAEVAEA